MIGKLTSEQLNEIVFKHLTFKRPEVMIRPSVGEDCAVVKIGDQALVISTDPITGSSSSVGKLAVNINLNDIASNGVEPMGLMLTVLAPVGTSLQELEQVISDAALAAAEHGVEIIGGHTEITDAVNRMVVSAVALGIQPANQVLSLKNIQVGDVILLTKTVGIEGTGILASEKAAELEAVLGAEGLKEAKAFLDQTSVVKEGLIAGRIGVSAMHDVTEGGLLGAVWEMCHGAGLGCLIHESSIPIHSLTKQICDHFEIDPLRLISSGAMLIIAPQSQVDPLSLALQAAGVPVQEVGVVTEEAFVIDLEGEFFEIAPPEGDALFEVLG